MANSPGEDPNALEARRAYYLIGYAIRTGVHPATGPVQEQCQQPCAEMGRAANDREAWRQRALSWRPSCRSSWCPLWAAACIDGPCCGQDLPASQPIGRLPASDRWTGARGEWLECRPARDLAGPGSMVRSARGAVHLHLLICRQLVELAHRHPATDAQGSGVAFLTRRRLTCSGMCFNAGSPRLW